jgi:dTDP-4-amino-4,6-dideoxygalactose transaminase
MPRPIGSPVLPGMVRQSKLAEQGIATQVAYPSMLPAQAALAKLPGAVQRMPVAEQVVQHILALPMYPELTPEAIRVVAGAMTSATARQ